MHWFSPLGVAYRELSATLPVGYDEPLCCPALLSAGRGPETPHSAQTGMCGCLPATTSEIGLVGWSHGTVSLKPFDTLGIADHLERKKRGAQAEASAAQNHHALCRAVSTPNTPLQITVAFV